VYGRVINCTGEIIPAIVFV